ncbi:MAG: hypothetical protein PHP64_04640 [Actinomycetota bacterium]|nr:hypothetical protein [Actinomycetota bacterium]
MRSAKMVIVFGLLFSIFALLFVGCGKTEPEKAIEQIPKTVDTAKQTAREANLTSINRAIDAYYAENGTYPTDISQIAPYMLRGVLPVDPLGGTYYLIFEGGVPKAAVR